MAGVDPESGVITRLFNPRTDRWAAHFRYDGATIVPRTPVGRATVVTLALNAPDRLGVRHVLIASGIPVDDAGT